MLSARSLSTIRIATQGDAHVCYACANFQPQEQPQTDEHAALYQDFTDETRAVYEVFLQNLEEMAGRFEGLHDMLPQGATEFVFKQLLETETVLQP